MDQLLSRVQSTDVWSDLNKCVPCLHMITHRGSCQNNSNWTKNSIMSSPLSGLSEQVCALSQYDHTSRVVSKLLDFDFQTLRFLSYGVVGQGGGSDCGFE